MLKGGTTLIAQLLWVIYLTLSLTHNQPEHAHTLWHSVFCRYKECKQTAIQTHNLWTYFLSEIA